MPLNTTNLLSNKTLGKQARLELHRSTTCCFEQHSYGYLPLVSQTIEISRTIHAGHGRSKDELISDFLR